MQRVRSMSLLALLTTLPSSLAFSSGGGEAGRETQTLHETLRRLRPVAHLLELAERLAQAEAVASLGVQVRRGWRRAHRKHLGVPEQRALRLGGAWWQWY